MTSAVIIELCVEVDKTRGTNHMSAKSVSLTVKFKYHGAAAGFSFTEE